MQPSHDTDTKAGKGEYPPMQPSHGTDREAGKGGYPQCSHHMIQIERLVEGVPPMQPSHDTDTEAGRGEYPPMQPSHTDNVTLCVTLTIKLMDTDVVHIPVTGEVMSACGHFNGIMDNRGWSSDDGHS